MTATRLKPDGKPMRALRVLGEATGPRSEWEVWVADRANGHRSGAHFSAALNSLVERGLAKRSGTRGHHHWVITDAGREALRDG